MDWFERLTGFEERDYRETQARLEVSGRTLRSKINGASYRIGELEQASLSSLRERLVGRAATVGRLRFSNIRGEVRRLHQMREYEGALFQVASQFNLLEMTGPEVTPEQGVTRYACDPTQGPACAIACGAATVYRNYFAPVGDQIGQTAARQLDGLADMGAALAQALDRPLATLWVMRNGYCLPTRDGLEAISAHIRGLDEPGRDRLRAQLRIGVHRDAEVTDAPDLPGPCMSQAFCSALPVSYAGLRGGDWQPFAELVLEALYEATLLEAQMQTGRGGSNILLLTRVGGGAFGNEGEWIDRAIARALRLADRADLDVRLVGQGV